MPLSAGADVFFTGLNIGKRHGDVRDAVLAEVQDGSEMAGAGAGLIGTRRKGIQLFKSV